MAWDLITIVIAPISAAVLCWFLPEALARIVTVLSGALSFALALLLVPSPRSLAWSDWLRADSLSVVFVVTVTFLYFATAVFSYGYISKGAPGDAARRHYTRRFFAGINLFCWAMAIAPLMSSLALLWVAVEITTVVSALLVAIEDTDGAAEAAWKYVLIASMGLGVGLFATVVMYYAGSSVLGSFDLFYPVLVGSAGSLPHGVVALAFVLAVLGYGTKVGFVPVHTWLPDAHSEAPTPVSALLSGALLAVSFYAILRYFEVAERTLGAAFPRGVLLAFGIVSLLLAALYLAAQRDLKRLLAYSSVEHMGILAIGMSFAAPIAIVGVLLHILSHAAAKGTAFFGTGSITKKFGTKELSRIRGGIEALPLSGPMMVLAFLGLCAMPPFGMFRSEFLIVSGGLQDPSDVVAAILIVLVTTASFALTWYVSQAMATPAKLGVARGETSYFIVAAMVIGLSALTLLGVHPPGQLSDMLVRAAHELGTRP